MAASSKLTTDLLSIVIPVYNEGENIAPLIAQIHQSLQSYKYEIIYVDDYSTDHTRERILQLNDPAVTLVELKKNYGQSMALQAGFDVAKGTLIITLDGDGQNDPADLPHMIELCRQESWDVVMGQRVDRQDSSLKTIPSRLANWLIRKMTGLKVQDHGCALKVFKREVIERIHLYGELHRFIALLVYLDGARITQVPVTHRARRFGKSKYGLERVFKVLSDLILILFLRKYMQRPMHLFGFIGLISLFIGMAIFIYLVSCKIMGQNIWGRPIMIAGVVFIIGGLQFFTVGLILEMLTRTYFESQQKKPYQIHKITRSDRE